VYFERKPDQKKGFAQSGTEGKDGRRATGVGRRAAAAKARQKYKYHEVLLATKHLY
jgi:hypothetical protein